MKRAWFIILDFLLGDWLADREDFSDLEDDLLDDEETTAAAPVPVASVADYPNWSREPDDSKQGKSFLANEQAWFEWLKGYGKDSHVFEDTPPDAYPCVVVWTWKMGTGLYAMQFYWDFVYPEDFPEPAPLASGPDESAPGGIQ